MEAATRERRTPRRMVSILAVSALVAGMLAATTVPASAGTDVPRTSGEAIHDAFKAFTTDSVGLDFTFTFMARQDQKGVRGSFTWTEGFSPYAGSHFYYSGSGDNLDRSMTKSVTLPTGSVTLAAKVKYDIELGWDYAYLTVNGAPVATNLSTNTNPHGQNFGNGITGWSGGSWIDLTADLSAYVGQTVTLGFRYWTDAAVAGTGFGIDEIAITGLPTDGAESDSGWTFNGFVASTTPSVNQWAVDPSFFSLTPKDPSDPKAGGTAGFRVSYQPGTQLAAYVDRLSLIGWQGFHSSLCPGTAFQPYAAGDLVAIRVQDGVSYQGMPPETVLIAARACPNVPSFFVYLPAQARGVTGDLVVKPAPWPKGTQPAPLLDLSGISEG